MCWLLKWSLSFADLGGQFHHHDFSKWKWWQWSSFFFFSAWFYSGCHVFHLSSCASCTIFFYLSIKLYWHTGLSSTGIQHTNVNSDLSSIWIVSLSFWLVSLMKYRGCEVWLQLAAIHWPNQQQNQQCDQHFQWSCIKVGNFWGCWAVLASLTQWKGKNDNTFLSGIKSIWKRRETGDLKTGVWPASGAVGFRNVHTNTICPWSIFWAVAEGHSEISTPWLKKMETK